MADEVKLKSVRSTYLYDMMNTNSRLDTLIKEFLQKGYEPEESKFDRQLATINSYYKYALKNNVLTAYKNKDIIPMMFPKAISKEKKMPLCLPILLRPSATNGIQAIAVIDNFAYEDDKVGNINMDTQQFYTFLENAYIARLLQMTFRNIRTNTTWYLDCGSVFAHMFVRYLNKKYALNLDKKAHEKVMYLAAKYFYMNIMQRDPSDMMNNYAKNAAKANNIDDTMLSRLDDEMNAETDGNPYKDISTFITGLSKIPHLLTPAFSELTVRDYVREYTLMYGNIALFSLEHLTYFLFNIVAAQNNSFIAKKGQYAIKDIMGKTGSNIYKYICGIMRK